MLYIENGHFAFSVVIDAKHRFGTKAQRRKNIQRALRAAKRRSYLRRKRARPSWQNEDAMADIYREAARMTKDTGVPHEVDHIIPLQGVNVSGLHVPWNLRVITRSENRAKCNKML